VVISILVLHKDLALEVTLIILIMEGQVLQIILIIMNVEENIEIDLMPIGEEELLLGEIIHT